MKKNNTVLNIAAASVLAAFINPAMASAEVTVVECNFYPIDRYSQSPEQAEPIKQTAKKCVAEYANVKESQVSVMAVDFDNDKVLVSVTLSDSTKTILVTDKELVL